MKTWRLILTRSDSLLNSPEQSLSREVRRFSAILCILFSLGFVFIALLASWGNVFIKEALASQTAAMVRELLIDGDLPHALTQIEQGVLDQYTAIGFYDYSGLLRFQLGHSHIPTEIKGILTAPPTGHLKVEIPLYFDTDSKNLVGKLVFVYSMLTPVAAISVVWILTLIPFAWFLQVQKRRFASFWSREKEQERQAALGRVSAQLCHDLKTPMASMQHILACQTLEDLHTQKDRFSTSLRRLYAMVDKLKRADLEGLVRLNWGAWDLNVVVAESEALATSHQKVLLCEAAFIGHAHLDDEKLARAVANLIANALECDSATVKVSQKVDGSTLIIRVSNDGSSISEEFLQNLFKTGATWGKAGGTGQGLAYVRSVAEGHGGTVEYRREGAWTIFEMCLPERIIPADFRPQVETEADEPPPIREPEEPHAAAPVPDRKRLALILLSDERATLRGEVLMALRSRGITFSTSEKDLERAGIAYIDGDDLILDLATARVPMVLRAGGDTGETVAEQIARRLR